jgi:hypothetical protein
VSRQRRPKTYVAAHGVVYRLTEAAWLRLLRRVASGRSYDLNRLGTVLGPIESADALTRDNAKNRLRTELRRRESEGVLRPLERSEGGKLRWFRLAPGTYRALGSDGTEYEVYKVSGRGEPALWSIRIAGEDADSAAGKIEAQAKAVKLASDRYKKELRKKRTGS